MSVSRLIISVVTIMLAIWLGSVVGDRNFPTRVESVRVINPELKAGQVLLTERVVHREKLCHTTIDRMMFDSKDQRFDMQKDGLGIIEYPNGAGPLGRDEFVGRQTVPIGMAPGPARYIALVCYRCNVFQWLYPVCEPPRLQRFTILPP